MVDKDKMSIVVVSCDKYKDIVEKYLHFFQLNWSDCKYRLLVAMEEEDLNNKNSQTISCGSNTTWTERAIAAIEETSSPYILLSVDDLFISKPVSSSEFAEILNFMEQESIKYYRIPVFKFKSGNNRTYPGFDRAELIPSRQRYNVSIGTAIWDRNELLSVLGDGTKSAWDLEDYFLEQSSKQQKGYLKKYVSDKRFLLHSVHMVKGGKWIPSAIRNMDKLGYQIDYTTRGYISFMDRVRINRVYSWLSRKCPDKIRKPAKKILSIFGITFASKS